jgi:sugar phosphate isomerase/epimerase
MQLGFVSAIVPELTLPAVLDLARAKGYDSVEVMCWPPGKAERRYAGVTHIDVRGLTQAGADDIHALAQGKGVVFSGLGYYPNLLAPSEEERTVSAHHLRDVILASKLLGLDTVSTFIGRNWKTSVDENWPMFLAIWPDLIRFAEDNGIRIAIENCPMIFTADEWPGGKNLGSSPKLWDRMFADIPSANFGLNYDPSHLVWQGQDYFAPLRDYREKIFRVHAKDAYVDRVALNRVGIFGYPNEYYHPVLPGRGDIDFPAFFEVLREVKYDGFVTVEVEDRRYEADQEHRERALAESAAYLRPYIQGLSR